MRNNSKKKRFLHCFYWQLEKFLYICTYYDIQRIQTYYVWNMCDYFVHHYVLF